MLFPSCSYCELRGNEDGWASICEGGFWVFGHFPKGSAAVPWRFPYRLGRIFHTDFLSFYPSLKSHQQCLRWDFNNILHCANCSYDTSFLTHPNSFPFFLFSSFFFNLNPSESIWASHMFLGFPLEHGQFTGRFTQKELSHPAANNCQHIHCKGWSF